MISHHQISREAEDLADPTAPVSEGILLSSSVDEVLIVDPMTGDEVGDIAASTIADAETALKRFHEYEQTGRWTAMSPSERTDLMERLVGIFEEHGDSLAELATLESGTPIKFSKQIHVADPLAIMRDHAARRMHTQGDKPIAIIGYHQPLMFIVRAIMATLEHGRPCIIVASPLAPLTSIAFMNCILEADLPKGVVHMLLGTPDVIDSLARSAGDRIVNTAPGGTDSGSTPMVIERSSPSESDTLTVCRNTVLGYSTVPGQRPGVPHLFVDAEEFERYETAMAQVVQSLVVGDPWDIATDVGPLIRAEEGQLLSNYVAEIEDLGATVIQGMQSQDADHFPVPTFIHGLTDSRAAMNNTLCAPIAAVFTYDGATTASGTFD